ncbi:hypothetical protein CsatB_015367 [Cannabis sativa]
MAQFFQRLMAKLKYKKHHTTTKFISIFIGEEQKRYVVPIKLLSSKFFEKNFNEIKEALISNTRDELITVPCSSHMFESILHFLQSQKSVLATTTAVTDGVTGEDFLLAWKNSNLYDHITIKT